MSTDNKVKTMVLLDLASVMKKENVKKMTKSDASKKKEPTESKPDLLVRLAKLEGK
jgi:hypothetical protein